MPEPYCKGGHGKYEAETSSGRMVGYYEGYKRATLCRKRAATYG